LTRGILSQMRRYLQSLAPRLPRDVYVLEAGALVNAFGNGVALPFLLIYLHNVRGISFGLAGSAAAVQSTAALASGFLGGTLSDRLGPKRVLLGALVVMTVAFALMPLIRSALDAFLIYSLWGIGSGSFWPSQSAMLAGLAPAGKRAPPYALQRLSMNVGVALGGVALISIGSDMHGSLPYVLAILGAAAISAYATVELKKFAACDPFLTLPPAMLIAGVTMTLAGALFEHPDWARGASPSSIMAIFVVQGALIGMLGTALGVAGGVALALPRRSRAAPARVPAFVLRRLPTLPRRERSPAAGACAHARRAHRGHDRRGGDGRAARLRAAGMKIRTDRTAIALLIALLVLAYADILFMGRGFYVSDLGVYHYPMKHVVREAVRSGEFPYWNRLYSGGAPLAANPAYELFYPPQWLVYVLPFHFGVQLHILLHFAIAMMGMFLLLRRLGISIAAAAFGSIAFAFGGSYLSLSSKLPILFSISWMPLALWLLMRFADSRTAARLLPLAAVLAMQWILGEPTMAMQMWAIIGGWAVFRVIGNSQRRAALKRIAATLGMAIASSLLLAAVQLLPAIDFVRDTVRTKTFDFRVVANWSTPPIRLVELILPGVLRHLLAANGRALITTIYPFRADAYLTEIYAGLLVVLLALAGILAGVRGRWWRWASTRRSCESFSIPASSPPSAFRKSFSLPPRSRPPCGARSSSTDCWPATGA